MTDTTKNSTPLDLVVDASASIDPTTVDENPIVSRPGADAADALAPPVAASEPAPAVAAAPEPEVEEGFEPIPDHYYDDYASPAKEPPASTEGVRFDQLGLSERVLAAVVAAGYTVPTPIQAQAIPVVLRSKDVVGIAQTGTGKTASFVLPMMTHLEQGRARARMPRTLILEPTRELAAQVEENFNKYSINQKLTVALLIGGVSFDDQIKKLDRGVDVLIATPGRLLDHFERGRLLMNGVEILVIDEADRMLDMGFIPDIERICKMIPPSRQTLMFSATMPPEIQRLADTFLRAPVRIEVAKPSSTAATVTQRLVASGREAHEKRDVLRDLIRGAADLKNAIVFCNRKRDVQIVYRSLEKHGFNVGALHGDMDQRARTATLDSFRAGKLAVLVASDVAARGLDIPDVSHVFNFDVPVHAEDYIHRIGRTGRAGRSGTSVTIVTDLDSKHLAAVERLIQKDIEWIGEELRPGAGRPSSRGGDSRREGRSRGGDEGRREPRRSESGRDESRGDRPRRDDARRSRGPREEVARDGAEPRASAPRGEARPPRVAPERFAEPRPDADRGADRNAGPVRQGRDPSRDRRPDPRPAPAAAAPSRGPDPHRRDRRREEAEPEIVGLGDHVPAFLLRPTRPVRSAG
jgi:superfamily II DNA/RNA helicase